MARSASCHVKMCLLVLLCFAAGIVRAELRLPAVLGDNMVLQAGQQVPVWGWAGPGEKVTVTIAGKAASAAVDSEGRWRVALPALQAVQEPVEMVIAGSSGEERRLRNVLVGEVWLCCGPSNIFWPVKRCDNAKQEIATATLPKIRFFAVARKTADQPQDDCQGSWVQCSPESVGDASAVGYFFAQQLHQELGVPVGLVQSFWGGSRIEAWTSLEALQAEPALKPILDDWSERLRTKGSSAAAGKQQAKGGKKPAKPKKPEDPRTSAHRPACLYNGMIAPLVPYGIRGAITYQGLGNLFWAQYSEVLLRTMIADWRKRWGEGDFPFGMVQPSPYTCQGWAQSGPDAYSIQRESQLLVLGSVPNTGLALTMDIDAVNTLHFPQKRPVARRLAQWALATAYGRPLPYAGPIYKSMTVEGDTIRVRFAHADDGLKTSDGKPPTCFTIAARDGIYQAATAVIEGNTVIVRSDQVRQPVAVRFAWQNTDVPNLVNRHGLPASLFRSAGP